MIFHVLVTGLRPDKEKVTAVLAINADSPRHAIHIVSDRAENTISWVRSVGRRIPVDLTDVTIWSYEVLQ